MFLRHPKLRRILYRFKGKRWWHNRIYPPEFLVEHSQNGAIYLRYKTRCAVVRPIHELSNAFAGQTCHVVLSGPSIKQIEQPLKLAQRFTWTVNGSPALFVEHQMNFDAYVADDPGFVKSHGQDVVRFGRQARYCCFSYRTVCLLLAQDIDLSGLNIYLFDYHYMPFRRPRDGKVQDYFALQLQDGVGLCDTVAYIVLQLAYGMGFDKVALFGMDLSMAGRFYAEQKAQPQFLNHDWQKGIVSPMQLVGQIVQRGDWQVLNCAPQSRLDESILPKQDANTYLAQI